MTAAELGAEVLSELSSIDVSGHIGILLGAGASAAAGLPDWDTLAVDLLTRSNAIADEETAHAFLARQDPALSAEAARASAGDRWDSILRDALYSSTPNISPAPLHSAAAQFVLDKSPQELGLFTLNYDPLQEIAIRSALAEGGRGEEVFSRGTSSPRAPAGQYEVHHLHGFFGPTSASADSVVLTLSDYNQLGMQPRPWQVAALQDSLQRGPLILAGTSYRDPDVRQWIHDTASTATGTNVVVFLARQGLSLDHQQFELVKPALTAQWAALGVKVVATHDYDDAAQGLRELRALGDPDYAPPKVRAARLWQAHADNFTRLQQAHSDALAADLDTLRALLPTARKLTLWICDEHAQLVRWAANDVRYRAPSELRRISPGADSPWTAGACLGRNEMLVQTVPAQSATGRWAAVAAMPLVVSIPGGPDLPCGVISAATTEPFGEDAADEVNEIFAELSEKWSQIVGDAVGP